MAKAIFLFAPSPGPVWKTRCIHLIAQVLTHSNHKPKTFPTQNPILNHLIFDVSGRGKWCWSSVNSDHQIQGVKDALEPPISSATVFFRRGQLYSAVLQRVSGLV